MSSYNTKQKQLLTDYLKANHEETFTIDQLASKLCEEEEHPGKSTVYRIVDKLVEDGTVKRFSEGSSRQFLYRYAGEGCKEHLHMKCTVCGKIFHLSHSASEAIRSAVFGQDNFYLDSEDTTLFGKCGSCTSSSVKI